MRKRTPLELIERLNHRYAKKVGKAPIRRTVAEEAVRKEFNRLLRERRSDKLWPDIVAEVFGRADRRPKGLQSHRNVFRYLKKIADERGIDLERMHN